jgi:hypothetical protein
MTKPMTPQEIACAIVDRETIRTRLFYSGYSTLERQAIEQLAASPPVEPTAPPDIEAKMTEFAAWARNYDGDIAGAFEDDIVPLVRRALNRQAEPSAPPVEMISLDTASADPLACLHPVVMGDGGTGKKWCYTCGKTL